MAEVRLARCGLSVACLEKRGERDEEEGGELGGELMYFLQCATLCYGFIWTALALPGNRRLNEALGRYMCCEFRDNVLCLDYAVHVACSHYQNLCALLKMDFRFTHTSNIPS